MSSFSNTKLRVRALGTETGYFFSWILRPHARISMPGSPLPGQSNTFTVLITLAHVKRPKYLFVLIRDRDRVDMLAFLSGAVRTFKTGELSLISLLTGSTMDVSEEVLPVLLSVPADAWISVRQLTEEHNVDSALIDRLISAGMLLSDGTGTAQEENRRRNAQLTELCWEPHAALYYVMGRWKDNRGSEKFVPRTEEELERRTLDADTAVARYGQAPAAFFSAPGTREDIPLPLESKTGRLYELLKARRTTRYFDESRPMALDDLSTILYYTFGCHGYKRLGETLTILKKTSPSGGALHPIEAYPLVLNVSGLDSGLYHYNTEHHSLEVMQTLDPEQAREIVVNSTAGQQHFGSAHTVIVVTARFDRHFWKYRNHKKAYKVVMMDAAHISQAFYLVCTDLRLGAFFSAAVNEIPLEKLLNLDFLEQGVIGVCGCGVRRREGFSFTLDAVPYVPRSTELRG